MILNSSYTRQSFANFLENKFLPNDFEPSTLAKFGFNERIISSITNLGNSNSLKLSVLEVMHNSENDPRITLSKEIFNYMKKNHIEYALVAFIPNNNPDIWRLSFIKMSPKLNAAGGLSWENTSPRRYSFLLGVGQHIKTPTQNLLERGKVVSIDDLSQRFSIEILTDTFYKELFGWYEWASDEKTGVTYPNDRDDETDDHVIQEHLIRLITRLMFVWFIKQKKLIPETIFDAGSLGNLLNDFDPYSKQSGVYYNAILQNLFFASLNKKIPERDFASDGGNGKNEHYGIKTLFRDNRKQSWFRVGKEQILDIFKRVPFLNGGLFECLDKVTEDSRGRVFYYDGFSREEGRNRRAFLPNCLFFDATRGLINILAKYNWTIEENTPSDVDVALDPELLGKVFENLLAAYDPATGQSARKASGSFYTPREIVDYMVNESLESYLKQSDAKTSDDIIAALLKCKIIDPACGSGAFPMGILNKMLEKIKEYKPDINVYETKLALIKDCIYGVDIQPIAVQISKLRFFISLVCEQTPTDDMAHNYDIHSLPNLETKFVAANTLIGLDQESQKDLFDIDTKEIKDIKDKLVSVRAKHFSATTSEEKKEYRKQDKELRDKLKYLLQKSGDISSKSAKDMADWDPYNQNEHAAFFDPIWMFGEDVKDGFDIVIGNPPYGAKVSSEEKDYYKANYKSAETIKGIQKGSTDTYVMFIEKAHSLVRLGGVVNFIVPLSVTSSESVTALHNLLESDCSLISISSYSVRPQPVFENAMVNTSIIFFKKDNKNNEKILSTKMYRKSKNFNLEELVNNLQFINVKNFQLAGRYPKIGLEIERSILKKIFSKNKTINDFITKSGKNIYYRAAGGRYFKVITNYTTHSAAEKSFAFNKKYANSIGAILSSNLYFWFYQIFSDNLNLKSSEITLFGVPNLSDNEIIKLEDIYLMYLKDIEKNANIRKTENYAHIDSFKEYKIGKSKHIIDQIDDIICPLYGLTPEETEFIKNYELEFRVSDDIE